MGFWDSLNKAIEEVTGHIEVQDSAFVSGDELTSENRYSQGSMLDTQNDPAFSPDQVKAALQDQGYVPVIQDSPFEPSTPQILDVVSRQPSPFTVVDLTPSLDNGTALGTSNFGSGGTVKNTFPASAGTISKIAQMLNMPQVALAKATNFGAGTGITYQLSLIGNSFRVDRLPQGFFPNAGNVTGGNFQSGSYPIHGAIPIADVVTQDALAILLSGCFIQFESTDNPILQAQPGDTFDLSFSTVFVTVFGSGGRWRLTSGNNARVRGRSLDRTLRSELSVWDGGGLLDNPMFHPVPFSIGNVMPTQLDSGLGYLFGYADLISNYDDGSKLTLQAGTTVVGTTTNKGYQIAWIDSVTYNIQAAGAQTVQLGLIKTLGLIPVAGATPPGASSRPLWNDIFHLAAGVEKKITINLAKPIRVVLAGFDQQTIPLQGGGNTFQSGEKLSFYAYSQTVLAYCFLTVTGYMMGKYFQGNIPTDGVIAGAVNPIKGGLIPFNPYPEDCNFASSTF